MTAVKRIVVGFSGASGAALGIKALELLHRMPGVETHLVVSHAFKTHLNCEYPLNYEAICALADYCYDNRDLSAPIASGSFKTHGMLIMPCSMKTLTLAGALIMPPVATYYHNPQTIDDMTTQIAARVLDKLELDVSGILKVWHPI